MSVITPTSGTLRNMRGQPVAAYIDLTWTGDTVCRELRATAFELAGAVERLAHPTRCWLTKVEGRYNRHRQRVLVELATGSDEDDLARAVACLEAAWRRHLENVLAAPVRP